MAFYARLKDGVCETPRYGVFIYPGEQYRKIEDKDWEIVKCDERIETLTADEMAEIIRQKDDLAGELVFGHWRRSEKTIASIEDIALLEKVVSLAQSNKKDKIAGLAQDRIDELTPSK
jgi:hypothetical protein